MKHLNIYVTLAAALALMSLARCAPPFPKEMLDTVATDVAFPDLQKAPEKYAGKLLMLGGMIVETKNTKEGTQIEVLEKPLDGEGRPALTDETGGRFLIISREFLDAAVYQRGRTLTVVGEASGSRLLPLGDIEYRYPVLSARALHLWAPYTGPRFSIGVGVYKGY